MKRLMIPLLALLACAPLFAGEAERQEATKFMESQTALSESAKGETTLKLRMLGVTVGQVTFKVEHGEHEGKPCYAVTMNGQIKLGEIVTKLQGKAMVGPDLALLMEENHEYEGEELTKHSVYKNAEGNLQVKLFDKNAKKEEDKNREFEIKAETRLLVGTSQMIAQILLPKQAGKKFEFLDWDDDVNKTFAMTLEVAAEEELYGKKAWKLLEHGIDYSKDDEGVVNEDATIETLWLSGANALRIETAEGLILDSGPDPTRTAITKEALEKQDKECHAVVLFFMAVQAKSEDLVKKAVNIDRFIDYVIENDESLKALGPDEKAAVKEMIRPKMPEEFLKNAGGEEKSEAEKQREAAVFELLKHEENFKVTKVDGHDAVVFTDEAQKLFGRMAFYVEKNSDGVWQITWVGEQPEEKKEPEKTPDKEDEEGF
ncbi:MAG: hypothetical protein IPK87_16245 [Planctomycetes bacterium]|nr:hypothetical protein [Planctomycetota bacterium]